MNGFLGAAAAATGIAERVCATAMPPNAKALAAMISRREKQEFKKTEPIDDLFIAMAAFLLIAGVGQSSV